MTNQETKYGNFIVFACISVLILSILVMLGWMFHIHIITTIVEGYAAMKFNTAVSLALISVALLLVIIPLKVPLRIAQLLSLLALSLGILSLLQHVLNYDFSIDRVFYDHDADHHHAYIMSPHTTFCITTFSIALLWIRTRNRTVRIACQYLFHTVTLIGFIVLIGYLYNVNRFHDLSMASSMALHTAASFTILGVAASFINADLGVTGIFTGRMLGHLMARRLFFSMLVGIIAAGYLRILSHRYNIVSVEFGIALLTVTFIVITLILIWIVSSILNKSSVRIQRAKDNLNMVVESAPFALVLTDNMGNVLDVNKQGEILFGYKKEELEGKNVSILVPDGFRAEWMKKRNSFFASPETTTHGFKDEICSVKKNGTEFPIEIILTPIEADKETRILSFVIDITARKANEAIINKQLIELQSKNRELEQFNYISSHDLQEPLRTVLNYIQLLEEDYPELSDEIKIHLKTMESSVTRMSTVVRSLLDFGRLGRNKKLALTDCKKVIGEVITDLNTIVKDSGAVITLGEGHPIVYAYETEVRQLFQNLINNAIKFRKPDTVPHIDVSCRDIGGYYEFTVADNGIGIPPKYFEKIFDIFQRLNKECEFEGHGVGLANCKKIAEMHGGKIWVESVLGEGSTFKFTILNIKP